MRAYPIGRLFGIELFISPSWLAILALVTVSLGLGYFPQAHPRWPPLLSWGLALLASLLFFGSILLHELAHSLVARRYGLPVRSIVLFLFGGAAQIGRDPPSPRVELLIAVAGPLVSLTLGALAGALALLSRGVVGLADLAIWLAGSNVAVGLFNLVPGYPLDGGRVLRSALWFAGQDQQWGTRLASRAGQAVGIALVSTAAAMLVRAQDSTLNALWLGMIGWFLFTAAGASYEAFRVGATLRRLRVRDLMRRAPEPVDADLTLTQLAERHLNWRPDQLFVAAEAARPAGLVGLAEVRRVPPERWATTLVRDVMEPLEARRRIGPDDDAATALHLMAEEGVPRLPVLEADTVAGVVYHEDLMRAARLRRENGG